MGHEIPASALLIQTCDKPASLPCYPTDGDTTPEVPRTFEVIGRIAGQKEGLSFEPLEPGADATRARPRGTGGHSAVEHPAALFECWPLHGPLPSNHTSSAQARGAELDSLPIPRCGQLHQTRTSAEEGAGGEDAKDIPRGLSLFRESAQCERDLKFTYTFSLAVLSPPKSPLLCPRGSQGIHWRRFRN